MFGERRASYIGQPVLCLLQVNRRGQVCWANTYQVYGPQTRGASGPSVPHLLPATQNVTQTALPTSPCSHDARPLPALPHGERELPPAPNGPITERAFRAVPPSQPPPTRSFLHPAPFLPKEGPPHQLCVATGSRSAHPRRSRLPRFGDQSMDRKLDLDGNGPPLSRNGSERGREMEPPHATRLQEGLEEGEAKRFPLHRLGGVCFVFFFLHRAQTSRTLNAPLHHVGGASPALGTLVSLSPSPTDFLPQT